MAPTNLTDIQWYATPATIDWCEPNHTVTPLIAEFWNTISNISHLVFAAFGMYLVGTRKLELRFLIAYLTIFIVGIGSAAFHGTLLLGPQLLDEIPMLFQGACFCYCTLQQLKTNKTHAILSALFLFSAAIIISTMYVATLYVLFFQFCWGLTVAYCVFGSISQSGNETGSKLLRYATATFLTAFALWIADQVFCNFVQPFNFHALWHVLTSFAGYVWVVFASYARDLFLHENGLLTRKPYTITWFAKTIPYVGYSQSITKQL